MRCLIATLVGILVLSEQAAAEAPPLLLETKIPLGEVRGRIDHFGVDAGGQRLFVAELGNDSVGIVDLKAGKVIHRLAGLREPQGVGYVPSADLLYVANAGDGSLRLFHGMDFASAGTIPLGDDADNIRVDGDHNRVLVGYGSGGIALFDAGSGRKTGEIPLKAHPESFQLDETGERVFVNLPDSRQIVVATIATGKVVAAATPSGARANFPMALDPLRHRLLVAFRNPPKLVVFHTEDLAQDASFNLCGDADDVFLDARRHRIYVSCGEGLIDVFAEQDDGYRRIAQVPSASGARTSLFLPDTDRLYVGVRRGLTEPAAIWVFRPEP